MSRIEHTRFSTLDLAPIRDDGDAGLALRNSLALAQHVEKLGFELDNTQTQDNGVIIHSFKSGDEGYVVSIGRVGKQPDVEIFHHTKPKS